ncbi:hypothetical protein PINS_up012973 [Pythium insidiosum]|nr:hypothetical protein PINS_up012973 [Pythium insidiosum]
MVHFNVRLRDNIYAQWRHEYLDYKRLKRALKRQLEIDRLLSDAAATSADSWAQQGEYLPDAVESSGFSSSSFSSGQRDAPTTFKPPPSASASSEMQSLLMAPVAFEDLLEIQYDKVETAYEKHLALLRDQFALLRGQYRPDAPQAAKDSVKNTLMELHRVLNHLNNFALLNYTGLRQDPQEARQDVSDAARAVSRPPRAA